LGVENSLSLVKHIFEGVIIRETQQDIIRGCKTCQCNNPCNQLLPSVGTEG
jgi:hypothetical protein